MGNTTARRVVKNTVSLYIRMIVLTVISLFTVRVILNSLGAEDYGLYNVVAGFVSLFAFISGTLSIATQRYFAISLATDDWITLNRYYSVNLVIYAFISVVIIVVSETVGLWFVCKKLVIPPERLKACIFVYEFSIVSFVATLISCPFTALLVADENLSLYSAISVLEGILKVVVAYSVYTTPGDKLIVYSALLCLTSIISNSIFIIYGKVKYRKLKFSFQHGKSEYKEVFSFLNWNLIGAVASVGKYHGINIIMNLFFGAVINAARGIAFQVNSVVTSFSQNFMKAIDPQITKSYVADGKRFVRMICMSSKISFFLLYFITLPLIMNSRYVFTLWLKNVPDYTVLLAILALIDALICSITDPISTAVQAIGKIKWYQIFVGGLSLLNLPVAYIGLRIYRNPLVPSFVCIAVSLAMMVTKIVSMKFLYGERFSSKAYIKDVLLPISLISAVSSFISFKLFFGAENFLRLLLNVLGTVVLVGILIILFGMNKDERQIAKNLFRKKAFLNGKGGN